MKALLMTAVAIAITATGASAQSSMSAKGQKPETHKERIEAFKAHDKKHDQRLAAVRAAAPAKAAARKKRIDAFNEHEKKRHAEAHH